MYFLLIAASTNKNMGKQLAAAKGPLASLGETEALNSLSSPASLVFYCFLQLCVSCLLFHHRHLSLWATLGTLSTWGLAWQHSLQKDLENVPCYLGALQSSFRVGRKYKKLLHFYLSHLRRSWSTSMKRGVTGPSQQQWEYMKSIFNDKDYLIFFECAHCISLTSLMVTVKISVTHLNPIPKHCYLQCCGDLKYKTLDPESSCSTFNLQMSPAPVHMVSVRQAKPRGILLPASLPNPRSLV